MARYKFSMRLLLSSVVALLALNWADQAMAQQVLYDQYGNPVCYDQYRNPVVCTTSPVVVVPAAPVVVMPVAPVVAAPYLGPASVAGHSRRVARRTSRRVSRRR